MLEAAQGKERGGRCSLFIGLFIFMYYSQTFLKLHTNTSVASIRDKGNKILAHRPRQERPTSFMKQKRTNVKSDGLIIYEPT